MAARSVKRAFEVAEPVVAVRWSMFVAAFLYYTVLTLLALGGDELSDVLMEAAYGLPLVAYALLVVARLGALSLHAVARPLHPTSALT